MIPSIPKALHQARHDAWADACEVARREIACWPPFGDGAALGRRILAALVAAEPSEGKDS